MTASRFSAEELTAIIIKTSNLEKPQGKDGWRYYTPQVADGCKFLLAIGATTIWMMPLMKSPAQPAIKALRASAVLRIALHQILRGQAPQCGW